MPKKLSESIDRVYRVTTEEFQVIKKLLSGLKEEKESLEMLEMTVLAAINEIGKFAQSARPDNARLRTKSQPSENRVDLQGRSKWFSGTLHLMIRKIYDDDTKSETEKLQNIEETVSVLLDQLKTVRLQLEQWSSQDQERITRTMTTHNAWLIPRIHALAFEERYATKPLDGGFQEECLKELCLDCARLTQIVKHETETKEKMRAAESMKRLLAFVKDQLQEQQDQLQEQLEQLEELFRERESIGWAKS